MHLLHVRPAQAAAAPHPAPHPYLSRLQQHRLLHCSTGINRSRRRCKNLSSYAGTILDIKVKAGDSVNKGTLVLF